MSWTLFKEKYKSQWESFDSIQDTANFIGEEYNNSIKMGFSIGAAAGGTFLTGNPTVISTPFATAMTAAQQSNSYLLLAPILDAALLMFWTGAVLTNGAIVSVPGGPSGFVDKTYRASIDEFLDDLITAFNNHLRMVSGAIPTVPNPIPFSGYNVT